MGTKNLPRWEKLFVVLKNHGPKTAMDILFFISTTTPSKCVSELRERMRNGWMPGWKLEEGFVATNGKKIKRWSVRRVR